MSLEVYIFIKDGTASPSKIIRSSVEVRSEKDNRDDESWVVI